MFEQISLRRTEIAVSLNSSSYDRYQMSKVAPVAVNPDTLKSRQLSSWVKLSLDKKLFAVDPLGTSSVYKTAPSEGAVIEILPAVGAELPDTSVIL